MRCRCFLLLLVMLMMFSFPQVVYAQEQQQYFSDLVSAAGADQLSQAVPSQAQQLMEEAGVDEFSPSLERLLEAPGRFLKMLWEQVVQQSRKPFQTLGMILGTLVLCALLECTRETLAAEQLHSLFSAATVLFLTVSVILPAVECIRACVEAVESCSQFMVAFVPVFASVVTACGMPASGSVYYLFLFSSAQVVSTLVANYLVPLAGVYLALSIAGALSPQLQLGAMLNSLKSFVCWGLSFLLAGFVALLTMQSALSSSMDAFTLKTSKMLVSSFVPVVGSALSEAISTASGCLKLVKSAVGIYGIGAAVCTFLPLLLRTASWYLVLSIGAAAGEMLSVKEAPALLKSGASLMGILLAVQVLYMLLILVSTTLLMMTGVGI